MLPEANVAMKVAHGLLALGLAVACIGLAAAALVAQRFLLSDDASTLIDQAVETGIRSGPGCNKRSKGAGARPVPFASVLV